MYLRMGVPVCVPLWRSVTYDSVNSDFRLQYVLSAEESCMQRSQPTKCDFSFT